MFVLLILVFIYLSSASKSDESESPAKDYIKLVEFSNFAAVGYCVNRGLAKGRLGDKDSNCALLACKNDFLADVEIIKIFDFNRLNEVGTGFTHWITTEGQLSWYSEVQFPDAIGQPTWISSQHHTNQLFMKRTLDVNHIF